VGDDELWVDVALDQQVVMVHRGDALVYFTVASTGAAPRGTPKGTWHLVAKHALKDMRSRQGAAERYHVEDVPWALYFRSTYALHGAYWHWGFGRPASHGCVNLAPTDARILFERLGPDLPEGWRTLYPTAADPELVVRVRRGDDVGRDRR
jgi:lipoprotein-anchoring transpeptidase ErfK/SrfK